ncbi:MAG TPA: enoyl-CoA hydratase-related protein [Gaiellaceae bacterium]|jgi:enoyl-CoA hydratase|nr:enoyl-CoA hydratase-related protein [Gaiellaceae bacterium]
MCPARTPELVSLPAAAGRHERGVRPIGIRVEREDAIAIVTVERPEAMNALDLPTLGDLRDRLRALGDDASVGVVVLTGSGDRAFVAGADIKYMSGLGVEEAKDWGELGHSCGQLLETMPKPTIAAINGFALGGGCELALACDLRYAGSGAKLGQPEINLGIIPGWGGTQRLARACALGVAKELILTGRVVDAEEALRIGLVNGVHDPVLDKAREVATLLASRSPLALAAAKAALNQALQGEHADNLRGEIVRFGDLFATGDAHEGLTAFAEKREPRFAGR